MKITQVIVGILLFAVCVIGYQLIDVQGELIDKTDQVAHLQGMALECEATIDGQNAEIENHKLVAIQKSLQLNQSARRQIDLVLRDPQTTANDAAELNAWLSKTFNGQTLGARSNE